MTDLLGLGTERMTSVMFGQHARHVPAWLYIQNSAPGVVSFVGASRVDGSGDAHPLRYASKRTHQFILGELILRPHFVIGTDAYIGHGISNLLTNGVDPCAMLERGELILDPMGLLGEQG